MIDALVVWGDEKAIRGRIAEHWDAGADYVCIQAPGVQGQCDKHLLGLLARGLGTSLEVALDQLLRNGPKPFGHGAIARLGGRSVGVAVREIEAAHLCESR